MDYVSKSDKDPHNELIELRKAYDLLKTRCENEMTVLQLAEEKARLSEEKFSKAFMTSPDAVNINRLSDGMYISVNEGFIKMLGFSEPEVIGKTSLELNIWADPGNRKKLVNILEKEGKVENFEALFRHKNGSILIGLMSASIIELEGIPHSLNITKDITSRKQIEEALLYEQFLVNAVMDTLPDHVYFKDLESRFIRNSKSHIKSFGFDNPSQVKGKTDFDFFRREDAQNAFADEQNIIRSGQVIKKEEKFKRADNSEVWFEAMKLPLRDKNGTIIGTFGISRDITEQKKTEEQYHLLAYALKGINDCVSITDINDRVLFLNQAFIKTYGFNDEDLKNESISFIRSPNNPPEIVNEILPATLKGGWHGELYNRKKDGTEFLVYLSTGVVKDAAGEPIALIGIATDITERKKTEKALRQSEERFRSVTQSANDAIISVDIKGRILGWNRGAEMTFGYKESEISGLSLNLIIPEDYLGKHIKAMIRLEMRGEKKDIGKTVELLGKKKNGEVFPLELSLSEWETSDGKFFTGIIRDITRRKRTELENHILYEITQGITSTSNLDELLKLIHMALGKVVYAENFFIALINERNGLFSFPYFIDKVDAIPLPTSMDKSCSSYVFRTKKPFLFNQIEFEKLEKLNEIELVGFPSPSWIGIPLQTPSKVLGVMVLQHYEMENVYSDEDMKFLISIGGQIAFAIERKQAESEIILKNELLQAVNLEKDKFFSILAHDLRGPLSAFVEATKIITEQVQTMSIEEIKDITLSMTQSATGIYSLLENLLEWSRLQRGVMNFMSEKINLKQRFDECINVLSESAKKKRVVIDVSVNEDLEINADKHMFDTIVRNLISNALKFTKSGGKVSISAACENDNSVEIKISDSGIGMTPELMNKLFRIDEKTSRPGTDGEPSTGLGLLLCKEFIEKHKGKIRVESEVGKGTTFTFNMPLTNSQ